MTELLKRCPKTSHPIAQVRLSFGECSSGTGGYAGLPCSSIARLTSHHSTALPSQLHHCSGLSAVHPRPHHQHPSRTASSCWAACCASASAGSPAPASCASWSPGRLETWRSRLADRTLSTCSRWGWAGRGLYCMHVFCVLPVCVQGVMWGLGSSPHLPHLLLHTTSRLHHRPSCTASWCCQRCMT